MNFLMDKRGVFGVFFAILAPFVFAFCFFSFDVVNIFSKKAKFDNALREAAIIKASLDGEDKKQEIDLAFSNIYLKGIEDIEYYEQNDELDGKDILNYSAIAPIARLFINNEKTTLASNVSVTISSGAGNGNYTDYAFVLDYSGSMISNKIDISKAKKDFCDNSSENYDKEFCDDLGTGSITRLDLTQAVTKKFLKDIIKSNAKEVYYSLIPFTFGTQEKKEFSYLKGGKRFDALGSFFNLQLTFKDEYYVKDYNLYSGLFMLEQTHASIGSDPNVKFVPRTYEKDTDFLKKHLISSEIPKAKKLFKLLRTNILNGASLDEKLPILVDIDASLKNMFYLDRKFSYRFFTDVDGKNIDTDSNVSDENYRPYGIVYDIYPERLINLTPRMLDGYISAYELPLKSLKNKLDSKTLEYLSFSPTKARGSRPTFLASGILRGAAHLAQGNNKRQTMMIITDGADTYAGDKGDGIVELDRKFLHKGMCEKIKSGLKERGAKEVDIFIINISNKTNDSSKEFVDEWERCTGKGKVAVVDDFALFYKTFKNYALGSGKNSTRFIYKEQ